MGIEQLFPNYAAKQPPKRQPYTSSQSRSAKQFIGGCASCPRYGVEGINRVNSEVTGKPLLIWAQNPGKEENDKGLELVGPSGKMLWEELNAATGLTRNDCDVQNVVRCWTADLIEGRLFARAPSKEELKACQLYTDQAIEACRGKAKVHLILGQVPARQLLGKEYKKDRRFLWSNALNAHVVITDHPAYFVRGNYDERRLDQFRAALKTVRELLAETGGRYAYLEKQDYRSVKTYADAVRASVVIRKAAAAGQRISCDFEYDNVGGQWIALCYGCCYAPGHSYVFYVDHPLVPLSEEDRSGIIRELTDILTRDDIKKVFHYGSSDLEATWHILRILIRGYDYDTNYSCYFHDSGIYAYGLDELSARWLPKFTGYKNIILPEAAPGFEDQKAARRAGMEHLAAVPEEKLTRYNGGDTDVCKRLELMCGKSDHVPEPLLHLYMEAAFTFSRMEDAGPLLDYQYNEQLAEIYPVKIANLEAKLRELSGRPDLNPGSPDQIHDVIYNQLHLTSVSGEDNTRKETLELMAPYDEFPKYVIEYRQATKAYGTYIVGYRTCADLNDGRLATKWWLTGASTGRSSSGDKYDPSKINLQNIHSKLKNLLMSDPRWVDLYDAWSQQKRGWWKPFTDLQSFLISDHAQLEIRVLAQDSQEPKYIEVFESGGDIHSMVGHDLTGWDIQKLKEDEELRRRVKNMHFGLVYGLTGEGLWRYVTAKGVKIAKEELAKFVKRYFSTYRVVRQYIDMRHKEAEEQGYVTSRFGFRRYLNMSGEDAHGYWGNQAVNTPIQGTAHHLMVVALALMHRKKREYKLIRTPAMEIHDSFTNAVAVRDMSTAQRSAVQLMEQDTLDVVRTEIGDDWTVPLQVDTKAGFRYGVTIKYSPDMSIEEFLTKWCSANYAYEQKSNRDERARVPGESGWVPYSDEG